MDKDISMVKIIVVEEEKVFNVLNFLFDLIKIEGIHIIEKDYI